MEKENSIVVAHVCHNVTVVGELSLNIKRLAAIVCSSSSSSSYQTAITCVVVLSSSVKMGNGGKESSNFCFFKVVTWFFLNQHISRFSPAPCIAWYIHQTLHENRPSRSPGSGWSYENCP